MKMPALLSVVTFTWMLSACQSLPPDPVQPVADLDLPLFMGDWYVIASIPTFLESSAHNAVETYQLTPEGNVATTFRFRDGAFDGAEKIYRPTAFVSDQSNAVWGMQFIWPIKAEFLVIYVDEAYQRTIIGRSKRDYIWLMARTPFVSRQDYVAMIEVAGKAGYDVSKIRRVPQQWIGGQASKR
jgi:apolipoprotein D and lipocalin family protein